MAVKLKRSKARGTGIVLADILHLVLFGALSFISAFRAENIAHFLLGLIINASTAHCISRLYVSFSFLNHTHGINTFAHLVFGMLSIAYALPGWYKMTFPYHAMATFEVGGLFHQLDLYYRTLCYVGQVIVITSGMIMLRKSLRMPWAFVQTFSFLTQIQLASIIQHFLILTYSQDEANHLIPGTRTFLAVTGFATTIVALLINLANYVQMKKAWGTSKDGKVSGSLKDANNKEDLDWMDIFVNVFAHANRRHNPDKWSQTMIQFADIVLMIILSNTSSMVIAQVNLMTAGEIPGLLNRAAAFYICAMNDTFILGFTSAQGFDTTLLNHRKLSFFSTLFSIGMGLVALATSVPHASHVLTPENTDALASVWKGIFWPMLGSVH